MDLCFENRYEFFFIADAEILRGDSKASRWFCMRDVCPLGGVSFLKSD